MRYLLVLGSLIGLVLPVAAEEQPTRNSISINEFYPNPVTGGKEWVELYNAGDTTVSLDGWRLCDNRSTSCTIAKLQGNIEPWEWLLLTLSSSYLNNDGDSVILYDTDDQLLDRVDYGSTLPTPKKGEALARLSDGVDTDRQNDWALTADPTPGYANYITPADQPVGAIIYSPPLKPAPPEPKPTPTATIKAPAPAQMPPSIHWKISLPTLAIVASTTSFSARDTADTRGGYLFYTWIIDDKIFEGQTVEPVFATSGLKNVTIAAASTSGSTGTYRGSIWVAEPTGTLISISEIYPDDETFSEFIELHNASTSPFDISNWRLAVENGKQFIVPSSTTIPALGYAIFSQPATGISLINTGATLYLLSSSTTLADTVTYGKISSGQSYQMTEDGWQWAPPNPGTPFIEEIKNEDKLHEETVKITSLREKSDDDKPVIRPTIQEARDLPTKTKISIQGQVAALPGVFGTQFFYLVDQTGGLQIFRQDKKFPALALGQWVNVTGVLSTNNSIPRLKAESIAPKQTTTLAATTSTITEADSQAGKLVIIYGEITKRLKTQFYIDDGEDEMVVTIKKGADISTGDIQIGDLTAITGIIERTTGGLELWPRSPDDIQIINKSENAAPEKNQPRVSSRPFILPTIILLVIATWLVIKKTKKHR